MYGRHDYHPFLCSVLFLRPCLAQHIIPGALPAGVIFTPHTWGLWTIMPLVPYHLQASKQKTK